MEHSVSERLIERMDEMLAFPQVDPHGDPIPTAGGEVEQFEAMSLVQCQIGKRLRVVRVSDQRAEFLQLVEREGLKPGREITVVERDASAERVLIERPDRELLNLGSGAASKILVSPLD